MSKQNPAKTQETKSKLKVLKKKGLYSGDLRKAPTRYAESLTRKFSDVLSGHAKVITVPHHAGKKSKGIVAARKEASQLAEAYGLAVRNKGAHLIVKTVTPEDTISYSPKKKLLEIVRKRSDDVEERIELRKHLSLVKRESGEFDLDIRKLQNDESYVIPFNRGRGSIQYIYFADKAELMKVLNEYRSRWEGMENFVSIARLRRRK